MSTERKTYTKLHLATTGVFETEIRYEGMSVTMPPYAWLEMVFEWKHRVSLKDVIHAEYLMEEKGWKRDQAASRLGVSEATLDNMLSFIREKREESHD